MKIVLVLAATLAAGAAGPAAAQFGGLFDPPRPPSDVPSRPPVRQPVDPRYQSPDPYPAQRPIYQQPTYQQPAQQPTQPAQQAAPATPFQPVAPDRGVQSQPLPPPPGAAEAPPAQPPIQQGTFAPPPAGQPPAGQTPPATNAALQPGDEVVTTMPTAKIANPTAVFSGLDKITGRITTFEAAINETVEFGALRVTPRACYTRPPTEPQNTDGFLEVDEITLQGEARRIFTGWMFAASPGLHAVEHPIYDVWLTDCKGGDTTVAGVKPPEPEPPPPPPPPHRAPAKKR
jgi:hypothetical protein